MLMTDVFLWFVIYSVIGWVYESIIISIQDRHLVNSGFLNGPLIPIYGIGAVVVYFSLNGLRGNILLLFLLGAALACTVEYLTALLLETLFDTKWWDYSTYKFNLQGRICLIGAVVFGLFSVALIEWIHPFVKTLIETVSPGARNLSASVFVVAIAVDTLITVRHILRMNGRLREIQEAFDRFSDYASGRASDLRNSVLNGIRETTSDFRETTGEMRDSFLNGMREKTSDFRETTGEIRDSFLNGVREKTSDLRETTGEMRDSFMNGVREKTSDFRETTGGMRDSFMNGMRKGTSSLRESADGILKSLLERFEKSEFFSDRIRSLLAIGRNQSLRLSRAFPRMRHLRYGSAWMALKRHLQDRKSKGKS